MSTPQGGERVPYVGPQQWSDEWFRQNRSITPIRGTVYPHGQRPGIDFNDSDPDNAGRLPASERSRRIGK